MYHLKKPISFLCVFVFCFLSTPLLSQEALDSLNLKWDAPLHFVSDDRLDFGASGTVDIGFYIDDELIRNANLSESEVAQLMQSDTEPHFCIIANGNETKTRFAIMLNKSLTSIGLFNGKTYKSIPFNFRSSSFFRVFISTQGNNTSVVINDELIGTLTTGYSKDIFLPLHIGTLDGQRNPFTGSLWWARIWNTPMSVDDIKSNPNLFAAAVPNVDSLMLEHLVGYTVFSSNKKQFFYFKDVYFQHDHIGNFGEEVSKSFFPDNGKISQVIVDFTGDYVSDIIFSYQMGEQGERVLDFYPTDIDKPSENIKIFELDPDEYFKGIAGTYDESGFLSMRILTTKRSGDLWTSSNKLGPFTYLERLPEGNKLKGYSAELVDRKLVGINFYSNLSNILSPQSIGLFTSSDFGQPTRADEIARKQDDRYFDPRDNKLHLHGNYTTPEIYKIFYNSHDQSYSIIGENLPNKTTKNYLTRISPKSTYHWGKNNGNVWEGEGANMVKLDETTFYGINKSNTSTPYIPLITLKRRSRIKTAKPAPSSNDKIQWGGTFSFDQRPPQLQYNFMGYNIAKMDYQNYQLNTGVTNMVFQLPDENSTDYYFSTNGKILPHGIIFKNDREAFNKARSHLVSTEKEHLEAWNMNLGFSIGVPEAMSFGLNYSHKESVDKMRSTHKTHGLSISSEILYALVLDKTNIPLNEEFKQMIFHIRDQYLIYGNGTTPASGADLFEEQTTNATKPKNYIMFSWYNWLLENYGTHYPYAVSYGGSAYQEFELSNKRTKVTKEQGYEISGKISASAEEVQGGLDGGGGSSSKDVDDDGVEDKISNIRTIGGTLSTGTEGGNWSLPDHSEVPVLLDLRPLYELLSPVFFDDPIIYTVLRKGLVDALKRYEEKFQISEESWEYKPKEYEFSFDNIYVSNRRGKQVNLMGALRANTVDFVDPQKTQITFLPDQISKDNPSYNMFEFANNFSTRDAYKSIFAIEQLNKKMSFSVVQDEFCETGIEISAELLESPLTAEEFDYFMKASDMEKTAFLLKKGWEFGLTEFMNFFSRESNDLNQKYTQSKIIRLKDIKPGSTYNDVISFKKNGFEISFFFKIEQVNVDNTNSWNIPCKSNR